MSNSKEFEIVFDCKSGFWMNDQKFNVAFVKAKISYLMDLFTARGYLFVREIYEHLGLPITKESITAGWHKNGALKFLIGNVVYDSDQVVMIFESERDIREYF